jgi:hypothetical protein
MSALVESERNITDVVAQAHREREREINYPHLAETTNLGPTHG